MLGGGATADALDGLALTPRASVVVATHGEVDEGMLERVLGASAGYVSLVASRKRAGAVVESLPGAGCRSSASAASRRPPAWTSARSLPPRSR